MSAELGRMSAVEMRQRIVKKELSPVEITKRALEAAESTQNAECLQLADARGRPGGRQAGRRQRDEG